MLASETDDVVRSTTNHPCQNGNGNRYTAFVAKKMANAYNHKQIQRLDRKETANNTAHALERARMRKLRRAGFVLCIVLLAVVVHITSYFLLTFKFL